ncbi:hypothetical protein E2C01_010756 [Portunus trituberculatus]|uniref:Ig-like domain-containing protein n=1 Tax=Portunus trituberculatus TaxID=210409 RepID=A0A5B7D9I1_PORTR|nr:hypothetical protein [Portunus trituberculatus]
MLYFSCPAPPRPAPTLSHPPFAPLWVRLLSSRDPLSSGRTYKVVCQAAGARPPATITWRLGPTRLNTHTDKWNHARFGVRGVSKRTGSNPVGGVFSWRAKNHLLDNMAALECVLAAAVTDPQQEPCSVGGNLMKKLYEKFI